MIEINITLDDEGKLLITPSESVPGLMLLGLLDVAMASIRENRVRKPIEEVTPEKE